MDNNLNDFIDLISEYPAPYLFIGTGFAKRYANAPNWEDLLRQIARKFNINLSLLMLDCKKGQGSINYPKLGSLLNLEIEKIKVTKNQNYDFRNITAIKEEVIKILQGIENNIELNSKEILFFKVLLGKISGIITTNYDLILEYLTDNMDFTTFVGQNSIINKKLILSEEIYKIHGCINKRETIVLTENDYEIFENRRKYILGKLTVIFAEYPLIFIGYSLEDENIKRILKDLMVSLSYEELKIISSKWLFVEYKKNEEQLLISEKRIEFENGNRLIFKCVETDNYELLYKNLSKLQFKLLPEKKTIKFIKKLITEYELNPNSKITVTPIDNIDSLINLLNKGEQINISFGSIKEKEFLYLDKYEIMKDLVLEHRPNYTTKTKNFIKEFKSKIQGTYYPRFKYFTGSTLADNDMPTISIDEFNFSLTKSITEDYRNSYEKSKQIKYWLWLIYNKKTFILSELKEFLKELFEDTNSWQEIKDNYNLIYDTDLRKLITAYDILKYKDSV